MCRYFGVCMRVGCSNRARLRGLAPRVFARLWKSVFIRARACARALALNLLGSRCSNYRTALLPNDRKLWPLHECVRVSVCVGVCRANFVTGALKRRLKCAWDRHMNESLLINPLDPNFLLKFFFSPQSRFLCFKNTPLRVVWQIDCVKYVFEEI